MTAPLGKVFMQDRNNMQEGLLTPSNLGEGGCFVLFCLGYLKKWLHCGSRGSCQLPSLFPNSSVCVCFFFPVLMVVVVEWSCQETAISFLLINSVPGGCSLTGLASCFLLFLWMAPSEPPACPWPGHGAAR